MEIPVNNAGLSGTSDRKPAVLNQSSIARKRALLVEMKDLLEKQREIELQRAGVNADPISAASTLAQKGLSFGLRPVAAGAGAALGQVAGQLEKGQPFLETIPGAKYAYEEARGKTEEEQNVLSELYPKIGMASEAAGAAATAPFTAARGLKAASLAGGAYGLGEGLGRGEGVKDLTGSALLGAALGGGVESLPIAGRAIKKTNIGKRISDLLSSPVKKAESVAAGVAGTLTGVNKEVVDFYARNTEMVDDLAKKYGDDFATAADDIRQNILNDISRVKTGANDKISNVIKEAGDDIVDGSKVRQSILDRLGDMNKTFDKEQIDQLTGILSQLDEVMDVNGDILLSDLNAAKNSLYEKAKPAYQKDGKIFINAKKTQFAAKNAAREAKKILDVAAPDLAEANKSLEKLHNIESKISGNLLKVGKPEGPLLAAASGSNKASQNILKKIEALTGQPALSGAKALSALRSFGPIRLMPEGTTGLTASRMGTGGLIGAGIGSMVGAPYPFAVGGALATSPAALKGVIKGGKAIRERMPIPNAPMGRGVLTRLGVQNTPEKIFPRNVDPSSFFIGSKGNQAKQAIRKMSAVPDDALSSAADMGGTANFFDAFNTAISTQEIEPVMTSLSYLNNKYGFRTTREILDSLSGIEGIITKGKIYRALSTIPDEAKAELVQDFEMAYSKSKSNNPIVIQSADIPIVIKDISRSNVSSTTKAKMINSLTKSGMIAPDLYNDFIEDKVPRTQEPLEDKRYFQRLDTRR